MSKKKLLSLALVVIMIATLSFSTLAWFTDDDSAENKFTVGGAGQSDDPNPEDKIFSVDVKENVDGEDDPVDEMDFGKVLPGGEYTKKAYVENTGSYDQYIRVVMTVTDWNELKSIASVNMADDFGTNWRIVSGGRVVDDALKAVSGGVNTDGNLVVTMYLNKKLAHGDKVYIMDYVKIAESATQEDFTSENFADGFQITFKADAVQTENLLDNYGAREWENAKNSFAALEQP